MPLLGIWLDVVNATVSDPAGPTMVAKVKALAALAVTQPTHGVLTYAATVSLLVEIFKPSGTAALVPSVIL